MTTQERLQELATTYGIATGYWSVTGEWIATPDDTLLYTLDAMGVNYSDGYDAALRRFHDAAFTAPLPACVVHQQGHDYVVNVHVHAGEPAELTAELEDGTTFTVAQVDNWTPDRDINGTWWGEASFRLPDDAPLGWHELHLRSTDIDERCTWVVTPQRLSTVDAYVEHPVSGVMAQLYSVRSSTSWGMGDFHDLATLAGILAREGADFLLINPIHAAEPYPPMEDSPYLPSTRRFINPIYLSVEDTPEFTVISDKRREKILRRAQKLKETNTSPDNIERNPIYRAKLKSLWTLFRQGRTPERIAQFQEFLSTQDSHLRTFAQWCADGVVASNPKREERREELIEFYSWLQFLCDEQLGATQQAAKEAGMTIGIMQDLAVGVNPGGADARSFAQFLAPAASVGAPPDTYNQQGQDWSQPPWNPSALAKAGYKPWRDLLRAVLKHSGAIRVDHVLGLFRLFWIPRMQSPALGTYVNYDYNALVGILALEAERAGCLVIGEDLGTFEPWVQDALSSRGIMGTSILWFESEGSQPKAQGSYRALSLASITTHDLPPTAGYLAGEHIALRERLGLLKTDPAAEFTEDLAWQNKVLDLVRDTGCFEGTSLADAEFPNAQRDERGETVELIAGLSAFAAGTPAALVCAALVDLVADKRVQNQPGTCKDLYPNWCIPLCDAAGTPVLLDNLAQHPIFRNLAPVALHR